MKSIEPEITEMVNNWLKDYGLDYKMEHAELNNDIDSALKNYWSKNGNQGGNRPDVKLLLRNKNGESFPILIEYKGTKGALEKLNADEEVFNKNPKTGKSNFTNIKKYAVNGAVHYANAILHYTNYENIIAIGVNGYKDKSGRIIHEIGCYIVSKKNLGIGQKIGEFNDLSFLAKENFDDFIEKIKQINLTEEQRNKIKEKYENEIDISLKKLNNDIYSNEDGLTEKDRVYIVAASIIASKGIPDKVSPLKYSDLISSNETGNKDGNIILRKLDSYFEEQKIKNVNKNFILRHFRNALETEQINIVKNGESQIKRIYKKVIDDLGLYYKIGLTTDFTGKLFNEMYSWLGFSQDKLNDVVLTPYYIANLLVELTRINKNSHVWDFTTGSAGLLVAAMNKMINDAKETSKSATELGQKLHEIKTKQLLGMEVLPEIYVLAVVNMLLMGGSASSILNKDSLTKNNEISNFDADALILNPPYSDKEGKTGKGMIFVEKPLNMMSRGYASIIIQNSAGSGKAKEFNKRILERNTLEASIKMPNDIFIGKAAVQTYIYVFKVNEPHDPEYPVKFIDFSNDGYTRTARKKSSINLVDSDNAKERYKELVKLVKFGKSKLNIFTEKEYYEDTIDPKNGADWNKSAPIDTKPILKDFEKTVSDYLSWEISSLLKDNNTDLGLGK